MLLELLQKANLFHLLHQIDLDFSEQHRRQGCPYCGGPLHRASYERKPRGGPETIPEAFCIRLSLCCGRRDCRRRSLPPSCLFMGRRVYWGAVVLVVITLRQQRCSGASASKLRNLLDISHKTLVRWMRYFREAFPTSSQWQRLRGLVPATVGNSELPSALLAHFASIHSDPLRSLIACLRFLATGQTNLRDQGK